MRKKYEYQCPLCGEWLSEDYLIANGTEMPFYCCESIYDVPIYKILNLKKKKWIKK